MALSLPMPMAEREKRALQFAIAASLGIHAVAFVLSAGVRPPKMPSAIPALSAVLRSAPSTNEPAPVIADRPEPRPEVTPAPQTPVAPKPKEAPKPEVRKTEAPPVQTIEQPSQVGAPVWPTPQSAPASPPPAAQAAPAGTPTNKPATTGPASAPANVASNAPSSAASSSASSEPSDPNAIEGYKVQLAAYAAKYRKYPATALQNNWEGIAEVKLTIGANGRIVDAVIAKSSGFEILDKVAIDMVRKAAPLTEIKPSLRNKEFSINLPIVFNIEHKAAG